MQNSECSINFFEAKPFVLKGFLLFVMLFFISPKAFAQKDSLVKDSLVYHKVLLVQFDTLMYLSDAEQDIMQQSEKKLEDYRLYLRKSLDNKIAGEVGAVIPCYSLLGDKTKQAADATGELYGSSSYQYDEPMKIKHVKSTKPKSSSGNSKENQDSKTALQYITVQGNSKYMNAVIQNKNLFEKLSKEYGTDLFLLINQFEIKTNYNSCLDIERHIYKREVIVSYSMYDARGKQVDGNLAHAYFPSNTNRDRDIAEQTFPLIAEAIANHVRAVAVK